MNRSMSLHSPQWQAHSLSPPDDQFQSFKVESFKSSYTCTLFSEILIFSFCGPLMASREAHIPGQVHRQIRLMNARTNQASIE